MALLAIVAAPLASVFWSAIRTAGSAAHRTDGASIASREIEAMRAIPYGQVGFYEDQTGFTSTIMPGSLTTVDLGTTSPSTGLLVPKIQPQTPDPNAAAGYAPDPDPNNALPIVMGGVKYTVSRSIVWINAQDATSTYAKAYKRMTVVVTWTDQAGGHTVTQESLLYPGGLGTYTGPMGGAATTTTTAAPFAPMSPVLSLGTALGSPADQTSVPLTWTQPSGGGAVTSYSIEYSTNPSFPPGNFTVIANQSPSVLTFTVTNLSPDTTYYFVVIAYAGALPSSASNRQSQHTAPLPGPACTLGGLNVVGAQSLSTTGTILQTNGKMSEDLTLSWTTTGPCTHAYEVRGVDPNGDPDPGSPYSFNGNNGSYSATVNSSGSKGWAIGLHTFAVWDLTTSSSSAVVKTFTVCVKGSVSC